MYCFRQRCVLTEGIVSDLTTSRRESGRPTRAGTAAALLIAGQ